MLVQRSSLEAHWRRYNLMKLVDIPRLKAGSQLASTTEISEMGGERAKLAARASDQAWDEPRFEVTL